MEKITMRYNATVQAVDSLKQAIVLFDQIHKYSEVTFGNEVTSQSINFEDVTRGLRDSVIQRFEYSTDLLWKYLKDYLEIVLKVTITLQGPKNIIRSCGNVGLLTEAQAEQTIEMIDSRNMTSHIYREEIAQIMAKQIPGYYDLMHIILKKTDPKA